MLILYFAIRKCVYFFILEVEFHFYLKSVGKVHHSPTMMKEASLLLLAALFPLAVPKCKLLFQ